MIPPQEYPHGYCTSGVLCDIGNFCGFLIDFSFICFLIMIVYLKYPLTFLMVSLMGFQCFHVRFSNDFVMCRGFKQLVSLRVFHRIIPLKNPVTSSK